MCRLAPAPPSCAVITFVISARSPFMFASTTIGNSRPLDAWTVTMRTTSSVSSLISASVSSPPVQARLSAARVTLSRSQRVKPRSPLPSASANTRAWSITFSRFAATWSPCGCSIANSTNRVPSSTARTSSGSGVSCRRRAKSRSTPSAVTTGSTSGRPGDSWSNLPPPVLCSSSSSSEQPNADDRNAATVATPSDGSSIARSTATSSRTSCRRKNVRPPSCRYGIAARANASS